MSSAPISHPPTGEASQKAKCKTSHIEPTCAARGQKKRPQGSEDFALRYERAGPPTRACGVVSRLRRLRFCLLRVPALAGWASF